MKPFTILTLCAALLILCLTGCTISEDRVGPSASNYVRLSEYAFGFRVYGALSGCQISAEGEVQGAWVLRTESCEASSGEAE